MRVVLLSIKAAFLIAASHLLFLRYSLANDALDAVVRIETEKRNGASSIGTGFFISDSGVLLTAYHVIEGSAHIDIVDSRNRWLSSKQGKVEVLLISTKCDIAILQVSSDTPKYAVPHHLEISISNAKTVKKTDDLVGHGHPQGIRNQTFRASTTQNGFMQSGRLNNRNGKPLCTIEDVDLIPIDMTIGAGMSGGPLMKGDVVIGVLSGSLSEGNELNRTIAWAMPVTYLADEELNQFTTLNSSPENINAWPKLKLMTKHWKQLSSPPAPSGESEPNQKVKNKWILQVNDLGDRGKSWETIGEYASKAEANQASLQWRNSNYAIFVAESDGVKTSLPPIVRKK